MSQCQSYACSNDLSRPCATDADCGAGGRCNQVPRNMASATSPLCEGPLRASIVAWCNERVQGASADECQRHKRRDHMSSEQKESCYSEDRIRSDFDDQAALNEETICCRRTAGGEHVPYCPRWTLEGPSGDFCRQVADAFQPDYDRAIYDYCTPRGRPISDAPDPASEVFAPMDPACDCLASDVYGIDERGLGVSRCGRVCTAGTKMHLKRCSSTNVPCEQDSDCGGGSCVVVDGVPRPRHCTDDSDCGEGGACPACGDAVGACRFAAYARDVDAGQTRGIIVPPGQSTPATNGPAQQERRRDFCRQQRQYDKPGAAQVITGLFANFKHKWYPPCRTPDPAVLRPKLVVNDRVDPAALERFPAPSDRVCSVAGGDCPSNDQCGFAALNCPSAVVALPRTICSNVIAVDGDCTAAGQGVCNMFKNVVQQNMCGGREPANRDCTRAGDAYVCGNGFTCKLGYGASTSEQPRSESACDAARGEWVDDESGQDPFCAGTFQCVLDGSSVTGATECNVAAHCSGNADSVETLPTSCRCACKPGYAGADCSVCDTGYFMNGDNECEPATGDGAGAGSGNACPSFQSCWAHSTGGYSRCQCRCKFGYVGPFCNVCDHGYVQLHKDADARRIVCALENPGGQAAPPSAAGTSRASYVYGGAAAGLFVAAAIVLALLPQKRRWLRVGTGVGAGAGILVLAALAIMPLLE